jgi:hypothetical protein
VTSENTNPVPSRQVQIEAFLPPADKLLIAEQERCLKDHAHMLGVYWDALISEKVPFHLAETLIEEYSSDCLGMAEVEDAD